MSDVVRLVLGDAQLGGRYSISRVEVSADGCDDDHIGHGMPAVVTPAKCHRRKIIMEGRKRDSHLTRLC